MMRDERKNIRTCLRHLAPFCHGGVICDTGSLDDSILVAKKEIARLGKDGIIVEHKWQSYSVNRNLALRALDTFIATRFGTTGPLTVAQIMILDSYKIYAFITDADNTIHSCDETCAPSFDRQKLVADAYMIESRRDTIMYKSFNLLRVDPMRHFRWSYAFNIHEIPLRSDPRHRASTDVVKGIYIMYGKSGRRGRDPDRLYRELEFHKMDEILYPEYLYLARTRFYIAQTLAECEYLEAAETAYTERFDMKNTDISERYVSALRAAECAYTLRQDIEKYLDMLYKAFELRCRRLEAIYGICFYYKSVGGYHLAWNFGHAYLGMKVDKHELFIDADITMYKFYELMSVCAYHTDRLYDSVILMKRGLTYKNIPEAYRTGMLQTLKLIEEKMTEKGL